MSSLKEKLYEHLLSQVYCKLGVSPLHGIGVFALRDIPKGTQPLNSMVSKKEIKFSRIELKKVPSSVRKHLASFCLVEKGRVFAPEIGMNAVNLSIYLNHSKTPNLRFNEKDVLEAMRDMHARLPGSQLAEFDAAHVSNLERPAEFSATLREFLREHPR